MAISADNRLGLDYRRPPARQLDARIIDVHTHVRDVASGRTFFEAADVYGVEKVFSMSPLLHADALRAAFGARIELIAVPDWKKMAATEAFRDQWIADLSAFRKKGARLCKLWMAPRMRERHGVTMEHPLVQPVIDVMIRLGYDFMTHVGDPTAWWSRPDKYADTAKFGTKRDQYRQLEFLLERVRPRIVIAAHLGGNIEDPPFLADLLDRHPHLFLDSSATKWVVREVSRRPDEVRAFLIRYADRILFGSDVVTDEKRDFDHYASRYWAHQHLWETGYRGESPIEDPDADGPPALNGVALPEGVLRKLYRENALRVFGV